MAAEIDRNRSATPFRANVDPHRTPLRGYAESAFAERAPARPDDGTALHAKRAETLLRIAAKRRAMREAFPQKLRGEAIAVENARLAIRPVERRGHW